MAEINGEKFTTTRVASGDLSGSQYLFVRTASDPKKACLTGVAGEVALGVLQNKPESGEHASVVDFGHTKVLLGDSLGPETIIMAGADGFADLHTTGLNAMGRLVTGGSSGTVGEMFVTLTYSLV